MECFPTKSVKELQQYLKERVSDLLIVKDQTKYSAEVNIEVDPDGLVEVYIGGVTHEVMCKWKDVG
jgi:hypothetical protein